MSSSEHSGWDHVLSVALLGTRRALPNEASLWPRPELSAAAQGALPEVKLLRAAAVQHLMRVAGTRAAPELAAAPRQTEVDRTRCVSDAAAMRLVRMIRGDYPPLIAEWLTLTASAQRELPPHFVPLALTHIPAVRTPAFSAVLGPTGRWLAELNPEWRLTAAVVEPSKERWLAGSHEERRTELRAMRSHDARMALDWLAETWPTDPPDAREALLGELAIGLSGSDEQFLDAALDDKRKAVRQTAAQLLARLPTSAFVARHCSRVDKLITFEAKKGLLAAFSKGRFKLDIELPQSPDKATQRDGIEVKPPAHRKIGERTFWLMQMVAFVPPERWITRFATDAESFVAAVLDTDYARELLVSLTEAVSRFPERAWIKALAAAWRRAKEPLLDSSQAMVSLLDHAPIDVQRELLVWQLSTLDALKDQQVIHSLLHAAKFDYGTALTQAAMDFLRTLTLRQSSPHSQSRTLFDSIAYRCDVSTASERLTALLAEVPLDSNWRGALEQLNDIVAFRVAMRREIL